MYANDSSLIVTQMWLEANVAERGAAGKGALLFQHATGRFYNVTIAHNRGIHAAGLLATDAADLLLHNSILASNSFGISSGSIMTANFSYVKGGWPGIGMVTDDPQLTGEGRLQTTSPLIDAGTWDYALPYDIDGEARWDHPGHSNIHSIVDIGADEFVDIDGDGIADAWELMHTGDLETLGTSAPDQYGLTDLDEYVHGTNPLTPDTSDDGFSDRWLLHVGINPLLFNYDFDHDGDGYTLREEFIAGTDPLDANSYFAVEELILEEQPALRWFALDQRVYTIEDTDNLLEDNWTPSMVITGQNAGVTITNLPGTPLHSYRLKVELQAP